MLAARELAREKYGGLVKEWFESNGWRYQLSASSFFFPNKPPFDIRRPKYELNIWFHVFEMS